VTFGGPPDAAVEAAFRRAAEAAKLIDLTAHSGQHPRMGATDVIPFIPLQDVTMEECVALANRLGDRIGRELGIPVFYYANAATRPDRQRLPDVRKGEFEGLRERIGTDPDMAPDAGPARIHPPAGATAVGARFFLIAYNVNLGTKDPALAQEVSRAIRESGFKGTPGLFKAVQASGFELAERGLTQVSMNLLDYRVTSPETVFAEIARRAAEAGVEVVESELVGLIPRDAVIASAKERLKLAGFRPEQVIEHHLDVARADVYRCFDPFLDALRSGAPTPGGGSASALAGAIGAALGSMVANLTIGKKKFAAVEAEMVAVRERLGNGLESLRELVRRDAGLYDAVMAATKLPKDDAVAGQRRAAAIEAALLEAARGPLAIMEIAAGLMPDLQTAAERGNPNAASDAAVGALLLQACVHGAAMNVLINAKALGAHPEAARFKSRTAEIRADVDRAAQRVVETVERGL
jgi:glutamate formiminotransferase/formiminotetrahydrofolate cyclodeaminase